MDMQGKNYKLALLVIGLLLAFESHAQKFKNSIYGEILGNAGYYSVNYERNLYARNRLFLSPSVGFSTLGRDFFAIPVLLHAYYGGSKHAIETAIGYTGLYIEDESLRAFTNVDHTYFEHYITGRIGYRNESEKGFLFKIAFTPLYLFYSGYMRENEVAARADWEGRRKFIPWFGISVGKSF